MTISPAYSLILIGIMAATTALLRFLPFLIFRHNTPQPVLYLGRVLPCAIIAMLVVYCMKGVSLVKYPYGIPELISAALVVVLHKWKHNTLLSIPAGTVCYMFLIQVVFG